MADLELRPPPFAQARSHTGGGPGPSTHPRTRSRNNPRQNPNTPSEGQNAEEAIMIGSSDEENEDERPLAAAGRSIAEQRARMHNNRTGTPIPRAPEIGLRVFSPPPMPNLHHLRYLHRRPDWPHQHLDGAMQQRLFTSGFMPRLRTPEGQHFLQRILGNDGFGRILGMAFGPDYMNPGGRAEPGAPAPAEEYDVRMTHASAKPRIGFSYDFAPDEEEENAAMEAAKSATPQVRTRTTIIIPDSPPHAPVDRKGKGRARDEDLDEYDILDLDPEESKPRPRMVVPSPGSSSSRGKKRKRQAVEIVEVLSDDESDAESGHASGSGSVSVAATAPVSQAPPPDKIRTVLVCASCRRPLKTGGDRLWALRCGHLIDSRCYRKLAERPIVPEDIPALGESDASPTVARTARGNKRRKVSGGRGKGKGKDKAPVPPVPQVVESIEWTCPVNKCRRVHWSERVSTGGVSAWQPMKETGAIAVFV